MEAHIPSFSPDTIASIGSFHITNTMINVWLALIIFFVFGMVLRKKVHVRPSRLQNSCEYFLESLFHYLDQVTGSRESTIKFFPVVGTVFFFILLSNWLGLLPGTGSITVDHAPLFRPANTDLNLTVAMALVSVISSHIFAFATIGFFSHANKFVQLGTIVKSLKKGPVAIFQALVEFMVGIIEIVGEMAKVMSLSLRLFGNIFAGEVLISVIGSLVSLLVPTPFMILEVLVGLIQASVFAILTTVYLTVATSEPHGSEH
ncbi:MAG: F0F1 ATP synthase subunit A [Candidatus Magasanikbacteria bacterium]|nr:F0F1 ATP synthase subunit A [Candidatus Magasanikbacteria bacterium]